MKPTKNTWGVFFFQKYGNFQRVSLDHFNKMYNKV